MRWDELVHRRAGMTNWRWPQVLIVSRSPSAWAARWRGTVRPHPGSGSAWHGGHCALRLWPALQPASWSSVSVRQATLRSESGLFFFVFFFLLQCVSYGTDLMHSSLVARPQQCLKYVQLPFMEDLRHFTFPSLENNKKFTPSGTFAFVSGLHQFCSYLGYECYVSWK